MHAAGRSRELDDRLLATLRITLLLATWAAAGLYALAGPLVEIVYQRGAFGAGDSLRVSALLALMGWAVPGWVLQQVAVRGFFARGEMWRPMGLGTLIALAAVPLYLGLAQRYGAQGLVVAGVLAINANALLTLAWARHRFGGPRLGPLLSTGLRAGVGGALAALAAAGVQTGVAGSGIADLALGGGVFAVVAVALGWGLGDDAMRGALRAGLLRIGGRLRGGRARHED
jgi:putative peptidoglycan lipid II flippase